MSIELMAKVRKLDLDPMTTHLLIAMADFANDDGTSVYPSIERLAYNTNLSESSVRRHLRKLAADGIIESIGGERGGRGVRREWQLHLDRAPVKPPFRPTQTYRRISTSSRSENPVILTGFSDADSGDSEADRAPVKGCQSDRVLNDERVSTCTQKGVNLHTKGCQPDNYLHIEPSEEPSVEPTVGSLRSPTAVSAPDPFTPYGVFHAYLDAVGKEDEGLPPAWRKRQLAVAKRLIEQGFGGDKVAAFIAHRLSETWRTGPFDLLDVERDIPKWEVLGQPTSAVRADAKPSADEKRTEMLDRILRSASALPDARKP